MWEACLDKTVKLDRKLPIGVGIDIGQTHDSTAVVVAQKQADERVVVRARVWTNPYPETHTLYRDWEMPYEEVRAYLRELYGEFPAAQTVDDYGRAARGPSFAYDPWRFAESAQMLTQEGLLMSSMPQTMQFMVPASSSTFELIKGERLVHDGDPVLSAHVRAATAEMTPRGWKVSKPKKSTAKKNDAAVALVMAVAQALLEPPTRTQRKPRTPVGF
jgi:phage terminase large subunit-like protein